MSAASVTWASAFEKAVCEAVKVETDEWPEHQRAGVELFEVVRRGFQAATCLYRDDGCNPEATVHRAAEAVTYRTYRRSLPYGYGFGAPAPWPTRPLTIEMQRYPSALCAASDALLYVGHAVIDVMEDAGLWLVEHNDRWLLPRDNTADRTAADDERVGRVLALLGDEIQKPRAWQARAVLSNARRVIAALDREYEQAFAENRSQSDLVSQTDASASDSLIEAGTDADQGGPKAEFYPARWYDNRTNGVLNCDTLRKAANQKRIRREKRNPDNPNSSNLYELSSVLSLWPEFRENLIHDRPKS
jgi:hypothetical protein